MVQATIPHTAIELVRPTRLGKSLVVAPLGDLCRVCGIQADVLRSGQSFCIKCFRWCQMTAQARRAGKAIPTFDELDRLLAASDGLKCGDCRRQMAWIRVLGPRSTCVSLQHYRDGTFGLVCQSCNTRHAAMPGDTFRDLPAGHKWCRGCKVNKPTDDFYPAKKGLRLHPRCVACTLADLEAGRRRRGVRPRHETQAETVAFDFVVAMSMARMLSTTPRKVVAAKFGVCGMTVYRYVNFYLDTVKAENAGGAA